MGNSTCRSRDLVRSRIRLAFSHGDFSEVIALAGKLNLAYDEDAELAFVVAKSVLRSWALALR